MRPTVLLLFAAFVAVIAPLANAADTAAPAIVVQAAQLTIDGTSTMHDYSLVTSTLAVTSAALEGESLLTPRALQKFAVQIPVNSFASDKDGLTKKFLETIKARQHPVITFALDDYTVDGTVVRAAGTLTVAGVTRPIDLELNVKETSAGLQVAGTRALSMKEFGIRPPTMFMGMLKTNDQVTITLELQLALVTRASH